MTTAATPKHRTRAARSSGEQVRRPRAPRGSGEQLRDEIVAAARDLLAHARNADDVSIRKVAQKVGITSPSIYLHFADKDELIAAVVSDVFEELDKAMLAAAEGITDPMQRLLEYGLAYVRFATSHPEHYRIATMDPCMKVSNVDEILADGCFTHFSQTVAACMQAGQFPPGDPLRYTIQLWTAAHGVASLMIAKPWLPWGDPEVMAREVLLCAAKGMATQD